MTEKEVWWHIEKYAEIACKALELTNYNIYWYVRNSNDPELKELGFDLYGNPVAQTLFNTGKNGKIPKKFSIVIYYDRQESKKDLIGTILHELLHVRMRRWDSLTKKPHSHRHHLIEEETIRQIERLILSLI